jgi:hypothetical protein
MKDAALCHVREPRTRKHALRISPQTWQKAANAVQTAGLEPATAMASTAEATPGPRSGGMLATSLEPVPCALLAKLSAHRQKAAI